MRSSNIYFLFFVVLVYLFCFQIEITTLENPLLSNSSYAPNIAMRAQTKALTEGRLSISQSLSGIVHDSTWHNGVQLTYGIGIALLRLPVEKLGNILGISMVPEKVTLLFYVLLLLFYMHRVCRVALGLNRFFSFSICAFVILMPPFTNMVAVRFAAYEEACAYLYVFVALALFMALDLLKRPRTWGLFLFSLLCGSLVLLRPTGVIVGFCLFASLICFQYPFKKKVIVPMALLAFASGVALQLVINYLRFGAVTEFGHNLITSSFPLDHYLKFLNSFHQAGWWEASKELFGALFLSPDFNDYNWFQKNLFPLQSPLPRFREFYFDVYGIFDFLFLVLAWIVGLRSRREEKTLRFLTAMSIFVFIMIFFFYLRNPLASRYLVDFSLSITGAYLLIFLKIAQDSLVQPSQKWKDSLRVSLAFLGVFFLIGKNPLGNDVNKSYYTSQSKEYVIAPNLDLQTLIDKFNKPWLEPPQIYKCSMDPLNDKNSEPKLLDVIHNGSGWSQKSCRIRRSISLYIRYSNCVTLAFSPDSQPTLELYQPRLKMGLHHLVLAKQWNATDATRFQFCQPADASKLVNDLGPLFISVANPEKATQRLPVQLLSVTMSDGSIK